MAKIQTGQVVDLQTMSQASAPIGEVKQSMLGMADFNDENLGTWYLCDGQNSVVGTPYGTTTGETLTPDMRGRVPRMKDHLAGEDADGNRPLGSNQDQATAKNGMDAASATSSNWQLEKSSAYKLTGIATNGHSGLYVLGVGNSSYLNQNVSYGTSTSLSGDSETRMKNTCVNFYIKVEY
jgi:hypothetical protein